jgi:hypothetical protein
MGGCWRASRPGSTRDLCLSLDPHVLTLLRMGGVRGAVARKPSFASLPCRDAPGGCSNGCRSDRHDGLGGLPFRCVVTDPVEKVEQKFAHERTVYDRVVARAQRETRRDGMSGSSAFHTGEGVPYMIDFGPPRRVAFSYGGLVDNWCGVVFDPTGEVLKINDLPPGGSPGWRNHPMTKLFGGDMTSCRPLESPYYFCCFT